MPTAPRIHRPILLGLPLGLLLAACSNGAAPADGGGGDAHSDTRGNDAAGNDAQGGDATGNDAQPDAGPVVLCDAPVMLDTTLMLDPGAGPNVNVAAAFDGQQVWIVYDRPAADGSGNFDVYAERMQCNGQVSVQPFAVNTVPMVNNVGPDIGVGDGHVYLAWAGDTGVFPNNLDIYFRTYQIDGTAIMPAEQTLESTHAGAPAPGSAWMAALAPLPGERFAIAGARAIDDPTPHFQTFVQAVDVHGTLQGPTLEPDPEPLDQQDPTLAATPQGGLYLGWSRVDSDGGYHATAAHYEPDAATTGAPVALTAAPSGGVSYAAESGGDARVYVAYVAGVGTNGDAQIVLADGTLSASATAMATLGFDGLDDETPQVAAAPGGGAVAWYEKRGSVVWDLHVQRFVYDGAAFQLGANVVVPITHLAPYYQPAITHVQGNTYFVGWSEGVSPALVLKGRFVNLP